MLQHPQFSIPIEVKINAGDQEAQCYDYHFYARNAKLVYLTKDDKTKPSLWTMQSKDKGNTLEESAVTCISWKSICTWLEEWRTRQPKSDQNAELLEQVRQYVEAIEWFLSDSKRQSADSSLACTVLETFKEAIDRKAIAETYQLEWLEDSYKSYCSAELKEKKKTDLQRLNFCPGVNYKVKAEGSNQKIPIPPFLPCSSRRGRSSNIAGSFSFFPSTPHCNRTCRNPPTIPTGRFPQSLSCRLLP